MAVSGTPQLALTIGAHTRQADYVYTDGYYLFFSYTVQMGDLDNDGISIGAAALQLNDGTIRSTEGIDADLSLSGYAITNDDNHKVDGSLSSPAVVNSVGFFSSPASGDTYERSEVVTVWVEFSKVMAVSGIPQLALTIDAPAPTRQALYTRLNADRTYL